MHSYPGQQFARGLYAGMSERFKEPVLKTGAGKLAVGSNPTSGAIAPCEQLPSYLRAEFAITLPKPAALVFNGKHTSLPSWGCRFESGTLLHAVLLKERHLFGTILWQVLSLLYGPVAKLAVRNRFKICGRNPYRFESGQGYHNLRSSNGYL